MRIPDEIWDHLFLTVIIECYINISVIPYVVPTVCTGRNDATVLGGRCYCQGAGIVDECFISTLYSTAHKSER